MKQRSRFPLIVFTGVQFFFYTPLLVLILFSFNDGRTMEWRGFSLRWYTELFTHAPLLWQSLANSILVALISATTATIIGTLAAVGLHWHRFRFKNYLRTISFLPLILPEIIIGVSLLIFFSAIHFPLGLPSILIAHTTFNIPFVLLIVLARLEEFDFSVVEAAYDCGAREIDALLRIIIPLSMPGIMAGFLLAVTLSLEDFVITFFVAGPGSSTLPLYVYSMIRFGVSPVINALSVFVIVATIVLALAGRNVYKYMFRK